MEHRTDGRAMAADLPDLPERMSAAGATVEQLDAFLRSVSAGGITHDDLGKIAPYRPRNIETKGA